MCLDVLGTTAHFIHERNPVDTNSHNKINLNVLKTIFDHIRNEQPIASVILRDSTIELYQDLLCRIGATKNDLDFSIESLKNLEKCVIDYHQKLQSDIDDSSTMTLIRELSAYIGEVLVRNTSGQWVNRSNDIWGTYVRYEEKWLVIKGNKKKYVPAISFPLPDLAASLWQDVIDRKPPTLHRVVKTIERKKTKEDLSCNN